MAKPTEAEISEWFKVIDADGSGKIDAKELRTVVKAFYDWQKTEAPIAQIDADVAVITATAALCRQCQYQSYIIIRDVEVSRPAWSRDHIFWSRSQSRSHEVLVSVSWELVSRCLTMVDDYQII